MRWDFVLAQVVVIAVVAVYARIGPKFVRESAAGPVGTGMLLAMLGLGLVWLLQLPFGLAEVWWQRRHDVTLASYQEWIVNGWFVALALGRMPRGYRNLGAWALRYTAETDAYVLLLTDVFPYSGPWEFAPPSPARPEPEPGPEAAFA